MKIPEIEKIQKRIANTCIGPSTLRNQGAKGVIPKARKYLSTDLDLCKLKDINCDKDFIIWLNTETNKLKGELPPGAQNWGTARKALNVFLEEAFYNRFLTKYYSIDKIEAFLEIPLDTNTFDGLKNDKDSNKIDDFPKLKWKGIKYLSREESEPLQDYALKLSKVKGISRIYLDLDYWRSTEQQDDQEMKINPSPCRVS